MLRLRECVPGEARGVADRLLQGQLRVTIRDDVQPVAIAPILGHAPLVGHEQDRTAWRGQALDLDQAQFAGVEVEAGIVSRFHWATSRGFPVVGTTAKEYKRKRVNGQQVQRTCADRQAQGESYGVTQISTVTRLPTTRMI